MYIIFIGYAWQVVSGFGGWEISWSTHYVVPRPTFQVSFHDQPSQSTKNVKFQDFLFSSCGYKNATHTGTMVPGGMHECFRLESACAIDAKKPWPKFLAACFKHLCTCSPSWQKLTGETGERDIFLNSFSHAPPGTSQIENITYMGLHQKFRKLSGYPTNLVIWLSYEWSEQRVTPWKENTKFELQKTSSTFRKSAPGCEVWSSASTPFSSKPFLLFFLSVVLTFSASNSHVPWSLWHRYLPLKLHLCSWT